MEDAQVERIVERLRAAVRGLAPKYCQGEPTVDFVEFVAFAYACFIRCIVCASPGQSRESRLDEYRRTRNTVTSIKPLGEAEARMIDDFPLHGYDLVVGVLGASSAAASAPEAPPERGDGLASLMDALKLRD